MMAVASQLPTTASMFSLSAEICSRFCANSNALLDTLYYSTGLRNSLCKRLTLHWDIASFRYQRSALRSHKEVVSPVDNQSCSTPVVPKKYRIYCCYIELFPTLRLNCPIISSGDTPGCMRVGNRIENLRKGGSISVDYFLDVAVAEKAILKLHSTRDGSPIRICGWSLGSMRHQQFKVKLHRNCLRTS